MLLGFTLSAASAASQRKDDKGFSAGALFGPLQRMNRAGPFGSQVSPPISREMLGFAVDVVSIVLFVEDRDQTVSVCALTRILVTASSVTAAR